MDYKAVHKLIDDLKDQEELITQLGVAAEKRLAELQAEILARKFQLGEIGITIPLEG